MSRGTKPSRSRDALRGLLHEALDADREHREAVLAALEPNAEPDVDDPVQMRLFVHGPLAEAVTQVMGRRSAERLVDHYELTRGLAEEADAERSGEQLPEDGHPNAGAVVVISPSYSLRDRLENLLDVEGFVTFSGADTAEAIALCKAESVALVIIDEDAPEALYDDPHRGLREALGSRLPATVLLTADDDRRRPRCPALAKALDPMAVLEVVHALASPGLPESSSSAPPTFPSPRTVSERWAGQSPYAPLVYEALELVAAPQVRDRLLAEALALADLEAVPADRTAFAHFVNEALRTVIARTLGEDDADAVVLDLQSTSGIHQRAAIMAKAQPSSIPPPEAKELEQTAEQDQSSGIHRPAPGELPSSDVVSASDLPTEEVDDGFAYEPLFEPKRARITPEEPDASPVPDDAPSHVRDKSVRVLLADDDETLLGMLERTLDAAGFEVATATNGRDALSLCLRFEPTVLVADMHMPVLNGRDVAQLLKRMREDRAPATILLTADPTVPRAIEDVAEVLGKPIRARHLVEAIHRAAGDAAERVV